MYTVVELGNGVLDSQYVFPEGDEKHAGGYDGLEFLSQVGRIIEWARTRSKFDKGDPNLYWPPDDKHLRQNVEKGGVRGPFPHVALGRCVLSLPWHTY